MNSHETGVNELSAHAINRMQSAVAAQEDTDSQRPIGGGQSADGHRPTAVRLQLLRRKVYTTHKSIIGGVLLVLIFATIAIAPLADPSVCPADKMAGAGELTVLYSTSSAPGADTGTQIPAPVHTSASDDIPEGGVSGRALWMGDPCLAASEDIVQGKEPGIDDGGEPLLDCDRCPPELNPRFNMSVLDGKILMAFMTDDQRTRMCGLNNFARALGTTGVVALVRAKNYDPSGELLPSLPGAFRNWRTPADPRGTAPQGGDAGIPMPFVDVVGLEQWPIIQALLDGHTMHMELTPTQPNLWLDLFCGWWLPIRAVLACSLLMMSEHAATFLYAHVRVVGRLQLGNFAHIALLAEVLASLAPIPHLVDPYSSFYWGETLNGVATLLVGAVYLYGAASTVLLAAYWVRVTATTCSSSSSPNPIHI